MAAPIITPIYCPDCKTQVRPEQAECSVCGASLVRNKNNPELKPGVAEATKAPTIDVDPLSAEILRQYKWICRLQTICYGWLWVGGTLMLLIYGPPGAVAWGTGIPVAIAIGVLLDIPKGKFRRGVASRGIDAAKWAARADAELVKSLFIVPPIGAACYLIWLVFLPYPVLWALARPTTPRIQAAYQLQSQNDVSGRQVQTPPPALMPPPVRPNNLRSVRAFNRPPGR